MLLFVSHETRRKLANSRTYTQIVELLTPGPASLDPSKPDFCSITHFIGYSNCDNGTSAATPIAAGVVALLKGGRPSLTQDQIKQGLKETAEDIGQPGWDIHSGAGIINAIAAFNWLVGEVDPPSKPKF